MTELEAMILYAVNRQNPSHGLAISRAIEDVKGKPPSVGSLYKALHRLAARGELSERWEGDNDEPHQGPPRRYYAISGDGARALKEYRREHLLVGRALGLKGAAR